MDTESHAAVGGGQTDLDAHATWFAPPWRAVLARSSLTLVVTAIVVRQQTGSSAARVGIWLVVSCATLLVYILCLRERASAQGLHRRTESMIPWTSIVSATRYGTRMKFRATIGASGASVSRALTLSPKLATAMQSWLSPDHPLVRAIQREGSRLDELPDHALSQASQRLAFRPSLGYLGGNAAGIALFGGFGLLSCFLFHGLERALFVVILLGFSALSAYGIVEYFTARYEVDAERLVVHGWFSQERSVSLNDVLRIRYSLRLSQFVLESRDGRTLRVCVPAERQLTKLAAIITVHCASLDLRGRDMLIEVARGMPLQPWAS